MYVTSYFNLIWMQIRWIVWISANPFVWVSSYIFKLSWTLNWMPILASISLTPVFNISSESFNKTTLITFHGLFYLQLGYRDLGPQILDDLLIALIALFIN